MTVEFIENDILNEPTDVLCHQVNCQGVMGSGLARQIRNRFPQVYLAYRQMCYEYSTHELKSLLGKAQLVPVSEYRRGFYVCNLYAQYDYGRKGIHTDREALKSAINSLMWKFSENKYTPPLTISIPYGMGCGLGGDNWEEVKGVIIQAFANADAKYKMNITLKIVKRTTER